MEKRYLAKLKFQVVTELLRVRTPPWRCKSGNAPSRPASNLSYALRGAKDNPEMESFNGRFKTEGHSLFLKAQAIDDLIAVVDNRMCYYNTERRHSSIGYVPSLTYIERVRSDFDKQL